VSNAVGWAPVGRLKGAALAEFVRWYNTERGLDALLERVSILPPTLRLELGLERNSPTLGILASRWYDCRAIGILLDAIVADASPEAYMRMADATAVAVMEATLSGVYRLLFEWLATPERYARFCDRLWSSYHDTGTMRIEHTAPRRAECTISGWTGHHPFLCAVCRRSAEVIYARMGCESIATARESCIATGGDACRFVTQWRTEPTR
jgi:hypothetical protein